MSGVGVARIGDTVIGTCSVSAPGHPRAFVGHWTTGSPNIKADGIEVVRFNLDIGVCDCGHTFRPASASLVVFVDDQRVHRLGDTVAIIEGPGSGTTVTASTIVKAE